MNIIKNTLTTIIHSMHHPCHFSTKFKQHLNLLANMPRDPKHIATAQRQRAKIKQNSRKYAPGTISLQVIGSGASGSPCAVYLFTDQSRYLFNCGEGTQRLANEHKTKITSLENIFITRTSWQRGGGLPGLSLTLQDIGVPNLTLHGPPGLGDIFHAMRRFVVLKDIKVDAPVCVDGVIYDDQILSVEAVSFKRNMCDATLNDEMKSSTSLPESLTLDNTDYYAHERNNVGQEEDESNATPHVVKFDRSQCGSTVMSFICRLKSRPGKLCLEKCVDKNVPPGPLLGQLKNGNDVVLPNGTTVYAHEVNTPRDPGPTFIVIDIPSEEYLDDFMKKENIFAIHQKTASNDEDVASVVLHFSPESVVDTPVYKEFINKFSNSTRHLMLNESNKLSGNIAAHRIQFQLNQLNEHIFPLLGECSSDTVSNKKIKLDESVIASDTSDAASNDTSHVCDSVTSSTQFHLRPLRGLERVNEVTLSPQEYINESTIIPGFVESLDDLKRQLSQAYADEKVNRSDEYPKIVFLGTGSCIPNKTRNVSAILVHTTPNSSILMDCGEGTCGQLIRFYGKDRTKEVLKNLKAIYVSHLHADHHTGLIAILQERRRLLNDAAPIMLLAPQQISSFLHFYDNRIESIRNEYFLVPNGDLLEKPLIDEHTAALGLNFISACLVRHCRHSFGVTFEIDANEPFKLTYSGDTIPCDELVRIGRNSTLLIHEATMEDELWHQAQTKMHSTISQAIQQGVKMNAKYTMLTHFSQRYAKLPRIEGDMMKNVGIAFDNMEVTSVDLKYLYLLHPTLKLLFTEHCELMEHKALKRAHREQSAGLLV